MSNAPFATNPILSAIAIAYKNASFIADSVLPRVKIGASEFRYTLYNKADRFTLQETMVGRKGRVNEVEFGGTEASAMVSDYGLEDVLPQQDINNAVGTGFDPKGNSTEALAELLLLDREVRTAAIVQNAANHTANVTLSGTSQWSDLDASDPIVAISDALEMPMMRPNVAVTNPAVALALRRHPVMVKAYNGTLGDSGMVPLAYLRDLFELDDILIGSAKVNTANKGQTMALSNVWGNHFSLIYRNPQASPRRGVTFGLTAEHGERVSQEQNDADVGLRGGTRIRVGESVKELVIATDVSYQFTNAIA
jgi:hypothetical protein